MTPSPGNSDIGGWDEECGRASGARELHLVTKKEILFGGGKVNVEEEETLLFGCCFSFTARRGWKRNANKTQVFLFLYRVDSKHPFFFGNLYG